MNTTKNFQIEKLSRLLTNIADQLTARAMNNDLMTAEEIKALADFVDTMAKAVTSNEISTGRTIMIAVKP